MKDPRAEQLQFFIREMAYLREEGAAFTRHFPGAAAALDISGDRAEDPQVERLLEAFAFITGRLQRNIEFQYPRMANALLGVLHPHLAAPVPSMTIAEFAVDPTRANAAHDFVIPRNSQLIVNTPDGAACTFSTAWDLHLWPVTVDHVDRPDEALFPTIGPVQDSQTILRLRLECLGGEIFPEAMPDRLRLRLAGSSIVAAQLYEALLNGCEQIWIFDPTKEDGTLVDPKEKVERVARRLPAGSLQPVGFTRDEALLPSPPTTHDAHRLLQEYYVLSEKFQFVDLMNLRDATDVLSGAYMDLVFVLSPSAPLPTRLDTSVVRLGSVPAVNLFRRVAEPVRVSRTTTEYLVQPDLRYERNTEIYSVDKVTLNSIEDRDGMMVPPLYSFTHAQMQGNGAGEGTPTADGIFWTMKRTPTKRPDMTGSDITLSFLDNRFEPENPASEVAFVHATCTNRSLAETIAPGTKLRIEADAPVKSITAAVKPTPQTPSHEVGESVWRLISHLSVGHLSLAEGPHGLQTLKETLNLLAGDRPKWATRQIDGLVEMHTRRIARRVGSEAWRGFCQGLEVTLVFDEEAFEGTSGYLFGTLLSHYLGLCTAANSFSELVMIAQNSKEEWARWPPRTGAQIVL